MAISGDWVTLYVNGIRYLEKPPLPYWLAAVDYHLFGYNVFCHPPAHGPWPCSACAILAWLGRAAPGGIAPHSTPPWPCSPPVGIFLFTRFLIPESLLTFFLAPRALRISHRH